MRLPQSANIEGASNFRFSRVLPVLPTVRCFAFVLTDRAFQQTDLTRQLELDPSRAVHDRVQDISMHSWVDYIQAKGIWPTSPRDFVNFVNWRLLSNGSVMIASFSHETYQVSPHFACFCAALYFCGA